MLQKDIAKLAHSLILKLDIFFVIIITAAEAAVVTVILMVDAG